MPVYIIKLIDKETNKDYYLEWSTIVDAPVTYGKSLDDFRQYYRARYGEDALSKLPERIARVNDKGTSSPNDKSVQDTISMNRAGEAECHIDYDDLVENYCINPPAAP